MHDNDDLRLVTATVMEDNFEEAPEQAALITLVPKTMGMRILSAKVTLKTEVKILVPDIGPDGEDHSDEWYQAQFLKQALINLNEGDDSVSASIKVQEETPQIV